MASTVGDKRRSMTSQRLLHSDTHRLPYNSQSPFRLRDSARPGGCVAKGPRGHHCRQPVAKKYGRELGDRIVVKGSIFPVNLELNIRGIFKAPSPTRAIIAELCIKSCCCQRLRCGRAEVHRVRRCAGCACGRRMLTLPASTKCSASCAP